jgi:hypothetical protein
VLTEIFAESPALASTLHYTGRNEESLAARPLGGGS